MHEIKSWADFNRDLEDRLKKTLGVETQTCGTHEESANPSVPVKKHRQNSYTLLGPSRSLGPKSHF